MDKSLIFFAIGGFIVGYLIGVIVEHKLNRWKKQDEHANQTVRKLP